MEWSNAEKVMGPTEDIPGNWPIPIICFFPNGQLGSFCSLLLLYISDQMASELVTAQPLGIDKGESTSLEER